MSIYTSAQQLDTGLVFVKQSILGSTRSSRYRFYYTRYKCLNHTYTIYPTNFSTKSTHFNFNAALCTQSFFSLLIFYLSSILSAFFSIQRIQRRKWLKCLIKIYWLNICTQRWPSFCDISKINSIAWFLF